MMIPSIHPIKTTEFVTHLKMRTSQGITYSSAPFFAEQLGAVVHASVTKFLIWHPDIATAKKVLLHLYIPDPNLIYDKPDQHFTAIYYSFEMELVHEFAALVMDNLATGDREHFGAFYEFEIVSDNNQKKIVRDPMAWSVPYGVNAPAEVYNIRKVLASRRDTEYFNRQIPASVSVDENRLTASANLLEIYIGTATKDGTIQSLTRRFKQVAAALNGKRQPGPAEQNLMGYDAIELMPIAPVVQHPRNHQFWKPVQQPDAQGAGVTIHLRKPLVISWGYDTPIFGAAAVNPSFLATGRPHELLELIETLHMLPGRPVKVILDVVYSHAHIRGEQMLPAAFFAGPNVYGKSINFKHPMVRSMILEMHRRKMSWGFDGVRVNAAQDFKYYDPEQDVSLLDDDFLKSLSGIGAEVKKNGYKPWMIFEDGRSWSGSDRERSADHREIMKQLKYPHQWTPAIFAHNMPYRYTFWLSRWWRMREQVRYGNRWISGNANHDTMRWASQADPAHVNVNFLLGNSLKMVLDNAFNNPSTTLLMNAFLPGVPMDFLQAIGNSPWSFFRNTDTKDNLKILAEEAFFSEWQITDIEYRKSGFFTGLKSMGFSSLPDLRKFMKFLNGIARASDWNTDLTIALVNQTSIIKSIAQWDEQLLDQLAHTWMNDVFEYCNADNHSDSLSARKTSYNLQVRNYRLENPWLSENFNNTDFLKYREPVDGTVIYYGYRKSEEARKEIIFLANMEGQPRQVTPSQFEFPVLNPSEWRMVLSTPSVRIKRIDQPVRLSISQGVLFEKLN